MSLIPQSYFNNNISRFSTEIKKLKKQSYWIAIFRTIVFLIALVCSIFFINTQNQTGLWITLMIAIPGFTGLYILHQNTHRRLRFLEILKKINTLEISKLKYDHSELEEGNDYTIDDHPYLKDLDIFGSNSIFQYLNRATTSAGKKMLADWLKSKAERKVVLERQAAIRELADDPDWMQKFQGEGFMYNDNGETFEFLAGFEHSLINRRMIVVWIFLTLGVISATIMYGFKIINLNIWLIFPVLNILFLISVRSRIKMAYQSTWGAAGAFKNHYKRILLIESHSAQSQKLNELKEILFTGLTPASVALKTLNNILSSLDNMGNLMYQILNGLLLLDMAILYSVDKWRRRYSKHLSDWLSAIYETEALVSMAGYFFANPQFTFPDISDNKYEIQGIRIGHPLIPTERRICNDFSLNNKGSIAIITGSNMAGKSTFLRTIGINVVLGLCGAPVCAESMIIPDMQVYTSMRTQDNLEKNMSSFYAELERIRKLINLTSRQSVLFLLDEILKGTNSQDRHIGAISLIRQLSQTASFGLVSTHDTDLANQLKNDTNILNYSFDSQIEGDQILFDFKLKKGICQNFNASQLMKKMGINVVS